MSDGLFIIDPDMRFALFNERYRQQIGVSEDVLYENSSVADLANHLATSGAWGPGDPDELAEKRLAALASDQVIVSETVTAGGRTVETRKTPLDAGGCVGVVSDISDRKRVEAVLRESEQRLLSMFERSPVSVALINADDTTVAFANARFDELLGIERGDLIGQRTPQFFVDGEDRKALMADFDSTGSIYDREIRLQRADGTPFWGLVTLLPFESEGRPARLVWIYDITENKRAEEAIRQSQEQLNAILESSPAGIAVTLRDSGKTVYANAEFAKQLQLGEDRNLGKDLQAYWADPNERDRVIGRAREGAVVEDVEVLRRRSDGSEFWALMSSLPIVYNGQKALLSWTYDITERKKAEVEIQETKERLEGAYDLITSSIQYASRIQRALLPSDGVLRDV